MIGIVDYGLGNIKAFGSIYNKLDIPFKFVKNVSDFDCVTKLILPGVGSFDHAMNMLNKSGLREGLDDLVLNQSVPVIGICVGMQMMADTSEEGELPGLGWIPGHIKKMSVKNTALPLPHMGWNDVLISDSNPLFKGLNNKPRFYFLHSYHFEEKVKADVIGQADYGGIFSSIINRSNIYGIQCHPEKSHASGIKILSNFAELVSC